MDESMRKGNQGEEFEHYRVLLFSIAYRMTGPSGAGLSEIGSCRPRTVYWSLVARTSPHIGGRRIPSSRP